jgi:hypothetical protein
MSYSDNLAKQDLQSEYLVRISPRYILTGLTLHAGSTYKKVMDSDSINQITMNGLVSDLNPAIPLVGNANGGWFFDSPTSTLYVCLPDGHLLSEVVIVLETNIFYGTTSLYANEDPSDSSTEIRFWDGIVKNVPKSKISLSESIFGFIPSDSTTVAIHADTDELVSKLNDYSFNLSPIAVWHLLGAQIPGNFKKIFTGYCNEITIDDSQVEIRILDRFSVFQNGFDGVYLPSADSVGQVVPTVFGSVDGVRLQYYKSGPDDTWVSCQAKGMNKGNAAQRVTYFSVSGHPLNTTGRTYTNAAGFLNVGDRIYLSDSITFPSPLPEFTPPPEPSGSVYVAEILDKGFDSGYFYINHTAISSPVGTNGVVWTAGHSRRVSVIVDGSVYAAYPIRDYDEYVGDGGNFCDIRFASGYDSNMGLPRTLTQDDIVMSRVYGPDLQIEIPGIVDPITNTNPIAVLYLILTSYVGIPEDEIAADTFAAIVDEYDSLLLDFSIPERTTDGFPTIQDLISNLLLSTLTRIYVDDSEKWAIKRIIPITDVDDTIDGYDLVDGSFSSTIAYNEILSDVIVEYNSRELVENADNSAGKAQTVSSVSTTGKYLHQVTKQKTFKSLYGNSDRAQWLADRLAAIFGDRNLQIRFSNPINKFGTEISQRIELQRERLPGFDYIEGTIRTKRGAVIETSKADTKIDVVIDDQKAISDFSGSF